MGPGSTNQIAGISWTGKTTNLGLIPVIFVDLFRVFRGKTPGLEFTQEGTTVPLSAYRGSSGQFPEWLTFDVNDP